MTTIELPELIVEDDHPFLRGRGLRAETLRAYGAGFSAEDDSLWMPSYVDGMPVFAKIRAKGKRFFSEGTLPHGFGLYGWNSPSTKKHVLVVEGEADAWAASQMMEGRMTVLSVPLGTKDAAIRIKADLDRLEQFERVYLMMDNDGPGQKAQAEAQEFLNPSITYPVIGREGFKDASDYLKAGEVAMFREVVYAAQHMVPKGFVSPESRAAKAREFFTNKDKRQGVSFGFETVDKMMGGQRPGEVITWVGGTGSGKSSFMRQLLVNLYQQQIKTLYVPLEDLPEVSDVLLAQLALGEDFIHNAEADPQALEDSVLDIANYIEVLQAVEVADETDILHAFEYGIRQRDARVIVLDHVTWLAESSGEATKTLQRVMPLIKRLAVRFGVTIHLVSHINRDKADKTDSDPTLARMKHSTAVAQASDAVVGLSGDREKNELRLSMLKQNRLWGRTETTKAAFTFTEAGRIIETEWEDRLEDYDDDFEEYANNGNSNEEAPQNISREVSDSEGGDKKERQNQGAKQARKRRTRSKPAPSVGVRSDHSEVPGDSGEAEDSRPDATEREVSGTEELHAEQHGDAGIVEPPPIPVGNDWATARRPLPGRQ